MKRTQTSSTGSDSKTHGVSGQSLLRGILGRVFVILTLLSGFCAALVPQVSAQSYSSTNYWAGEGADMYWPTPANWVDSMVPNQSSLVILTNSGSTGLPGGDGGGAVGVANIVITNDTTVGSLWVMNTNSVVGSAGYHTIQLDPGVTLTVSNNPTLPNIVQVCSQSGAGGANALGTDFGVNTRIIHTIQGEGGNLVVTATNNLGTTFARGNIFVGQGSLGLSAAPTIDQVSSILDLSGLDSVTVDANHILLGDGGTAGFYFNRPAGTIYLAKTNLITLWAAGNHPSANQVRGGIVAGIIAQNNGGGVTRIGKLVLGETNAIFCDSGLNLGIRGFSGWIGFNPSSAPGNSVAYFRDRAGTGRQALWSVGNRLNASSVSTIFGELDFSLGSVDAMVGTLGIAVSPVANTTIGSLEFGAGTIDADVLQLGMQTASTGQAQGMVTVSNSAVLKINTSGTLGGAAGAPGTSFAKLIVSDGGTIEFGSAAPITCGPGSSTEIYVAGGSSLKVNTVGAPSAPLNYLLLDASTLTIDRGIVPNLPGDTAPMCSVTTLETHGTTTVNVLGVALVPGTVTLIKYSSWTGGSFADLVLGDTPTLSGYLSNNVANSSIDLVITTSVSQVLTWNGRTNGVNVAYWDIGTTPSWQGNKVYSQAGEVGDLVRFDDTAVGTTAITLAPLDLSPSYIFFNNTSKSYSLSGDGALTGLAGLTKDGSGLLTLSNTASNTFSGLVTINAGTVRVAGTPDRLPVSSSVTIADDSSAGLELSGVDQTIASLNGGGASGGNISLDGGNLAINGSGSYAGVISGNGALIKAGSGTQTISAANTYSGGTVVSNATLVVANSFGSGLGSGPVSIGAGGSLQLGDGSVEGPITATTISNDGTLRLYPAAGGFFDKLVVGSGSLVKVIGNGTTLYITNANEYTGGSSIQQGIVQISDPLALGTGNITVGNATATDTALALSGDITLTNTITLSGKTGAVVPSPVGINNVSDILSGLPGTNTITGDITVTGATCWSVGSEAGKLIIAGNFLNKGSAALGQFYLRGSGEGLFMSALTDASATLKMRVEKNDSGLWTLSGINTYTGPTYVNQGTLIVNGALLGTSNVFIYSQGSFGGTCTISGPVTNTGSLLPGGPGVIGSMTINNALYLDVDAVSTFEVGPEGNDSVVGLTDFIIDGTLQVNLTGTLTGNCIFKLFDAQNYIGAFAGINLPDISPLSWDTSMLLTDGTLRATGGTSASPEVTGVSVDASGGFVLSGTGSLVAPYNVLATTNVALPLAQWDLIGSGTFSNGSFTFTDNSAGNYPQRFYLISTPSL